MNLYQQHAAWTLMKTFTLLVVASGAGVLLLTLNNNSINHLVPPLCGESDDPCLNFLIQTPGCSIPDFDVDDPSISKFKVKNPRPVTCAGRPPLTYVDGLLLHFNSSALQFYSDVVEEGNYTCCYRGIRRVEQSPDKFNGNCDKKNELTKNCTEISLGTASSVVEDGVLLMCYNKKSSFITSHKPQDAFYVNVHTFLQPRRADDKRRRFKENGGWAVEPDVLNVLILGTDSVSRLNLKRNMPQTFQYITEEMDPVDLKGYNKVADNTDPNLYAVLMGMSLAEHSNHSCGHGKNMKKTKFDDCPLIWKRFSERGYVTFNVEDAPNMGIFHYLKLGFVKEPTDYYNRPYALVSDKYIGHSNGRKWPTKLCQGNRSSMETIHNYALDVTKYFMDVPYFGLFWTSSITHDSYDTAAKTDQLNHNLLKTWNESDLLNRTVLIFMSDHGMRWGKIRETYAGMLEERLPYVMIVFPKWFKHKYRTAWNTLQVNSRRLVSNYDLHLTMLDILEKGFEKSSKPSTKFGHGQSLFLEIPPERTCKDAGIPEHYCTCQHTEDVDTTDPLVQEVVQFVLNALNHGLLKYEPCAQLHLNEILRSRRGSATNHTRPRKGRDVMELYQVSFSTVPGGGHFEASVKKTGHRMELSDSVSRTNLYGNQSYCITDNLYKMYCFCKDLLTPNMMSTVESVVSGHLHL